MKTIKRVLLSIILLQAVCQPINAATCCDLEAAAPSTVQYAQSQTDFSEPVKIVGGIAITLLMIHLAFVLYDWHKDNQLGQKQPEKKSIQEKANFAQFADDYTNNVK